MFYRFRERFDRSVKILETSWIVLRQDRELVVFPLVAATAMGILLALTLVPLYFEMIAHVRPDYESEVINFLSSAPGIFVIYLFFLLLYFIAIIFQSALIGCALMRLQGDDPTVKDGFKIALLNLGRIFVWSVITGSVGFLIHALSIIARGKNGAETLASALLGLSGFAWGILTYLVVPILVIERISAFKAIHRSGEVLGETWGEQLIGNLGINWFFWGFGLIAIPFFAGWFGTIGYVIGILYLAIMIVIAVALSGIFRAALYRYGMTGDVYAGYSEDLLANAFESRRDDLQRGI